MVSLIGLLLFAGAVYSVATSPINPEWILLSLVTVILISRIDIGIPKIYSTITISDAFLFTSILLYGPMPSVVLAGVDAAVCSLSYKNKQRVLPFNMAVMSLSVFISSTLVANIYGELNPEQADLTKLFVTAGTLALFHYILNSGLVSIVASIRKRQNVIKTWKESYLWTSISYFAGSMAACLIVKLITVISFYAFIIAVPILAVTYFTYKVYLSNVETSNQHAELMADLHLRTIEALAIAIDSKDQVSQDHVHRVQIYATGLARLFGLSEAEIEALKAGALLHDIGKLAVPDYILNKPGPLTPAEFDKMKVHTIVGAEILERVGFPYPVVPVVRHHHERWDGRGYPDGLKGEHIPMTARILSVADSFDTVREDRPYRKAMSKEQAIQLIKEGSGSVFDPNVVGTFLDHLQEFEAEIRSQRVEPQVTQRRTADLEKPAKLNVEAGAFERIRNANRELINLYDIAQTIGTSLELPDIFAVFSARLEKFVRYSTCILFLQRSDSTEIEASYVAGRHAELFRGRRMNFETGISGWVVANRTPMHNCDPQLDFIAMKADVPERYRTAIVVPLTKDDELIGALALYSATLPSYDADHLRLVEAVAKLASDAIANAMHHQRTETSALTDPITALPNARALRYRIEDDIDRARRHRDIFSVVMMDLDGFKGVNDRFGHQAGDYLLMELARLLLAQVRSSDFVSRYAGDEFVAIVHAGPEETQELVRRIQRKIDRQDFGFGITGGTIGISIGFATFGIDGETFDELLIAADRAMYTNKARRKAMLAETGELKRMDSGSYSVM